MTAAAGGFAARLAAGDFVVTSELVPPREADAAAVARSVEQLDFADALNITDLPRARPRVSALAAAALAIAAGAEPILQMTSRDRNRIALASDALGAAALGVGAVLPLGGDPLPEGVPGKAVGDLDAGGLVQLLVDLSKGLLPDGSQLDGPPPQLLVGAAASPKFTPAASLAAKISAGASFVQTQVVLDADGFAAWVEGLREISALDGAPLLPSLVVPASARSVELVGGFGAQVAPGVAERAEAGEGEAVAREIVTRLVAMPEVRGVHVLAIGSDPSAAARLATFAREAAAG
ncbi:MAG TPA: methylenetetrahydrofolate reductase [Gaiellales bacterium]|nr:methylenetetrahydrofolate reductase [Gaiellales bacterium]